MAFNQKEQAIYDWGLANNKSRQEVEGALYNLRTGFTPEETIDHLPSFREEITESALTRADRFGDILDKDVPDFTYDNAAGGETVIPSQLIKGTQLFGQGAGLASDVIEGAIMRTPVLKQAFQGFGKGVGWLTEALEESGLNFGNNEGLQEVVRLYDTDQDFKDTVDGVTNIARLTGDVVGAKQAYNWTTSGAGKIQAAITEARITGGVLNQIGGKVPPSGGAAAGAAVKGAIDDTVTKTGAIGTDLKVNLASRHVDPKLEKSVTRLGVEGASGRIKDPLAMYDDFLDKSKKALADDTLDPAISIVGERIGNSFGQVIAQRRNVGKTMAAEKAKVGHIKTNVTGVADAFLNEIGSVSRFAKAEQTVLNNYLSALARLGDNPTIAQIDDFLVRTNAELNLFSDKLTGVTNVERIIQGNMARLRQRFDPVKTGNPALKAWSDARTEYSKLTEFIKEGERHLGKLTQSGDYARDASIAKSAVQSVLNAGKKDWLLELERLTGYKAVDESVLALQAMKDAGDHRGLSLLQTFADSPSVSPTGIIDKISGFAVKKGQEALIGTPEQQTRLFIQSLGKDKDVTPSTTSQAVPPTPTASAINVTNYSDDQIAAIVKTTLADKSKAVILDSDAVKKAHPEFAALEKQVKEAKARGASPEELQTLSDEVTELVKRLHNDSSAIQDAMFDIALAEDTSGVVRLTSGGPASAKSEVIVKGLKDTPSIVVDGTLKTAENAIPKIDAALKAKKKVIIDVVYANTMLSYVLNQMRFRTVPDFIMLEGHWKYRASIQKLRDKYGDQITIQPYRNNTFGVKGEKVNVQNIDEYVKLKNVGEEAVKKDMDDIIELIDEFGLEGAAELLSP